MKYKLKRSNLFVVISVASLVVIYLLVNAGYLLRRTDPQLSLSTQVRNVSTERNDLYVDAGTLISASGQPSEPVVTPIPLPDGQSLLKNYCTQCHMVQLLDKTEKSRSDWEKTLAQMEVFGVNLKDEDKDLLLDYLAAAGER